MKPYIWQGRNSRNWYVDSGKPSRCIIGEPWGYRTWREAFDVAIASFTAEPTA